MIRKLENNISVIELGKGTTYISQVKVNGDEISSGIAFSNHNDNKLHGDEIIIEITDYKGIASYFRSILELIKTWDIKELNSPINELLSSLEPLLNFKTIDMTNVEKAIKKCNDKYNKAMGNLPK